MQTQTVMWRRLDMAGHDYCLLRKTSSGWLMEGSAIFKPKLGPVLLHYILELDHNWSTSQASVRGMMGDQTIDDTFRRDHSGWALNGNPIRGLEMLPDLDFSFTPATNLQQLRRAHLTIGEAADLPVAWYDVEARSLIRLQQRYHRHGEFHYWYEAPTVAYQGMLQLQPNGFISKYPGLWQIEI